MKSTDDIVFELARLEQTDCAALQDGLITYFGVCQKLHDSGKDYEKAVGELQSVVACKSEIGINNAVRKLRFAAREQGLGMLKASKHLAKLSSQCFTMSEKLASIISTEGDRKL